MYKPNIFKGASSNTEKKDKSSTMVDAPSTQSEKHPERKNEIKRDFAESIDKEPKEEPNVDVSSWYKKEKRDFDQASKSALPKNKF